MKYFDNVPVVYIEDTDIKNGMLSSEITKGKPTVVLGQGLFCGYCTKAKPAFAEFAEKVQGTITCATIQSDGEEGDKKASQYIKQWDKAHRGFPTYLVFGPNGKYISTFNGGRDMNALMGLAEKLKL